MFRLSWNCPKKIIRIAMELQENEQRMRFKKKEEFAVCGSLPTQIYEFENRRENETHTNKNQCLLFYLNASNENAKTKFQNGFFFNEFFLVLIVFLVCGEFCDMILILFMIIHLLQLVFQCQSFSFFCGEFS